MNPYTMLGLPEDCSDEDITGAFRKFAKTHHPDVGGDAEIFVQINIAVNILRDPYKRKMFDDFGICMDFSEDSTKQMAIGKFRELIDQWINAQLQQNGDININKFFNSKIREARNKLNEVSNNCELTITALKERMTEVSVNGGKRNLVNEMIQFRIDKIVSDLQDFKTELHLLDLIEEECIKYSSAEEIIYGIQNSNSQGRTSTSIYTDFIRFG